VAAPVSESEAEFTPSSPSVEPRNMVDREEDLGAICTLLTSGETRLLTVTGPGGSARLYRRKQSREKFPPGVPWPRANLRQGSNAVRPNRGPEAFSFGIPRFQVARQPRCHGESGSGAANRRQ